VQRRTEQGLTYVQGADYACYVDTRDETAKELVPEEHNGSRIYAEPTQPCGSEAAEKEVLKAIEVARKKVKQREGTTQTKHRRNGHADADPDCLDCIRAGLQQEAAHRTDGESVHGTEDGEVLGVDFAVVSEPDVEGHKYALVGVAAKAKWGNTQLQKTRTSKETLESLKEMVRAYRVAVGDAWNPKKFIIRFHHDDDTSFKGEVKEWVRDKLWEDSDTGGYASNKNARAEGRIKKVRRMFRAMLLTATGGTGKYTQLWGYGYRQAHRLVNQNQEAGKQTPDERLKGSAGNVNHAQHVFGAACTWLEPKAKRASKLEPVAHFGIWVGREYDYHRVCPLVWDQGNKRHKILPEIKVGTVRVRDEVFPLARIPAKGKSVEAFDDFVDQFSVLGIEDDIYEIQKIVDSRVREGRREYYCKWKGCTSAENTWEPEAHLTEYGAAELVREFNIGPLALLTIQALDEETKTIQGLLKRQKIKDDPEEWKAPYKKEMQSVGRRLRLLQGEERKRVLRFEKVVRLRMQLEIKRSGRRKCRMLVLGNYEPKEWDKKTDAPTASKAAVRSLIFSADEEGDTMATGDVTGAFNQSEGFGPMDRKRYVAYMPYKGAELLVYEMIAPINGQRVAPLMWYKTFAKFMRSRNFKPGKNEPCVFYNKSTKIRAVLHVDDILAKGKKLRLKAFFKDMAEEYEMQEAEFLDENGELTFLSNQIWESEREGAKWRHMSQENDLKAWLEEQNMGPVKSQHCPMPSKDMLVKYDKTVGEAMASWCRSTIGSLHFYANNTRYDLAHTMSRIGQTMKSPTEGTVYALKRVMAYVATHPSVCLEGKVNYGKDVWAVYADADHAGDRGLSLRSQTGAVGLLNGVPVWWVSRKQPTTAVSSAESEIYALYEAVMATRKAKHGASELGVHVPTCDRIQVDNSTCLSFQHRTNPDTRLRGCYDLRDERISELRDSTELETVYVHTDKNLADLLTKCHVKKKFESLMRLYAESSRGVLV